jgi:hypothetical protein
MKLLKIPTRLLKHIFTASFQYNYTGLENRLITARAQVKLSLNRHLPLKRKTPPMVIFQPSPRWYYVQHFPVQVIFIPPQIHLA